MKRAEEYVTPEALSGKMAEWLSCVRGAVAPRPHLKIVPARCGLIVVDMLNYFASPEGRCFLPAAPAAAARIALLVEAWRSFGGNVVFTRHCHTSSEDLGMLGKFFSDYIRCGEPEAEIVTVLAPRTSDVVMNKTTYDAFLGTALEEELRRRGLVQVLVTGVLTHLCCETTARSAFCRGFEVYVAADATASSTEQLHLGSLLALADGVAVIMSTEEILQTCMESR
ncbi:MAG: cysteine hydrolase [Candidatus Krumholzibacteria bacterium]|nr:cysteine hydrolase [Candidatus Krumholzibacteria bacterium]